jgi:hypothetical protein
MNLGELIDALENEPQDKVVPVGFCNPHSYRGYYDQLAFEIKRGAFVADMLADARYAVGQTFAGYKGGEYKMSIYTDVYLAKRGDTGEGIGPMLLRFMLDAPMEGK